MTRVDETGFAELLRVWQLARLARVLKSLLRQHRHADATRVWCLAGELASRGLFDACQRRGWQEGLALVRAQVASAN